MMKKQTFTVTIEYTSKDGCGNEVSPYTEGEIRQALGRLLKGYPTINVQEVSGQTLGRVLQSCPFLY